MRTYVFFIVGVVFLVTSCSSVPLEQRSQPFSPGTAMGEEIFRLGEEQVGRVIAVYRGFTRQSFEGIVNGRFVPLRSDFINQAERTSSAGNIVSFEYFVENAMMRRNKLVVGFTWEKTTQPYGSSSPVLSRGKAQMVFVKQNGDWQLQRISGDNPF